MISRPYVRDDAAGQIAVIGGALRSGPAHPVARTPCRGRVPPYEAPDLATVLRGTGGMPIGSSVWEKAAYRSRPWQSRVRTPAFTRASRTVLA
jgi:hypothetical protein